MTNGLVGSYMVTWPGGGFTGLTREASIEVALRKADETGLRFVDETRPEPFAHTWDGEEV
jgi:hypothetical protein